MNFKNDCKMRLHLWISTSLHISTNIDAQVPLTETYCFEPVLSVNQISNPIWARPLLPDSLLQASSNCKVTAHGFRAPPSVTLRRPFQPWTLSRWHHQTVYWYLRSSQWQMQQHIFISSCHLTYIVDLPSTLLFSILLFWCPTNFKYFFCFLLSE